MAIHAAVHGQIHIPSLTMIGDRNGMDDDEDADYGMVMVVIDRHVHNHTDMMTATDQQQQHRMHCDGADVGRCVADALVAACATDAGTDDGDDDVMADCANADMRTDGGDRRSRHRQHTDRLSWRGVLDPISKGLSVWLVWRLERLQKRPVVGLMNVMGRS